MVVVFKSALEYMQEMQCTHLCKMYFPININWTSLFPILVLLGGIFHFDSNFKRNFCNQTVENLIRRRILRRLIWFCTVCQCPTKRTLARLIWVKQAAFSGQNILLAEQRIFFYLTLDQQTESSVPLLSSKSSCPLTYY